LGNRLESTKKARLKEANHELSSLPGRVEGWKDQLYINRHGYHLIIDDVRALVCEQCQVPLFTETAVRLVQQMIRTLRVTLALKAL